MRLLIIAATAIAGLVGPASAASLDWADWTTANTTTASGTLSGNSISFSGNITGAQTDGGGTNYWADNSAIYTPTGAENPPPDSDIIRLTGGSNTGTQTITFGVAVTNPYMSILSLGQTGVTTIYDFINAPFDIVNQGTGHWGGNATALSELAGDILSGNEGHGLIQFSGTFTSISWTVPNAENWHGFQIAVAAIPLPASLPLLIAGLGALGMMRRRRRA